MHMLRVLQKGNISRGQLKQRTLSHIPEMRHREHRSYIQVIISNNNKERWVIEIQETQEIGQCKTHRVEVALE